MSDFIEFEGLSFHYYKYKPAPVVKSAAFLKIQEKWQGNKNDNHDNSDDNLAAQQQQQQQQQQSKQQQHQQHQQHQQQPKQSQKQCKQSKQRQPPKPKRSVHFDLDDSETSNDPLTSPVTTITRIAKVENAPHSSNSSTDSPVSVIDLFSRQEPIGDEVESAWNKLSSPPFLRVDKEAADDNDDDHFQWVCAKYWGRTYRFIRPIPSFRNKKAAIQIQRILRGGMQRLHYKVMRLQHLLDTSPEQTHAAVAAIRQTTKQRKRALRTKADEKIQKDRKRNEQCKVVVAESAQLIDYLRRENKKLRDSNTKLQQAIHVLKDENQRLVNANEQSDGCIHHLAQHAETIFATHQKLCHQVLPQYQAKVEKLQEAIEIRQRYQNFEHKVVTMYLKLFGSIADRMDKSPTMRGTEFADKIMTVALEMEDLYLDRAFFSSSYHKPEKEKEHHQAENNKKLRTMMMMGKDDDYNNSKELAEEDEEIDAYTVHTMDD